MSLYIHIYRYIYIHTYISIYIYNYKYHDISAYWILMITYIFHDGEAPLLGRPDGSLQQQLVEVLPCRGQGFTQEDRKIQPGAGPEAWLKYQWPFQEPIDWRYLPYKRPIFQAYVREYPHKIWPKIWYSTSILGSWNSHWKYAQIERRMPETWWNMGEKYDSIWYSITHAYTLLIHKPWKIAWTCRNNNFAHENLAIWWISIHDLGIWDLKERIELVSSNFCLKSTQWLGYSDWFFSANCGSTLSTSTVKPQKLGPLFAGSRSWALTHLTHGSFSIIPQYPTVLNWSCWCSFLWSWRPPGKNTFGRFGSYPLVIQHSYWKWPFIVDFPIKNGDFP
jgi:hypothetical protein